MQNGDWGPFKGSATRRGNFLHDHRHWVFEKRHLVELCYVRSRRRRMNVQAAINCCYYRNYTRLAGMGRQSEAE